MFLLLIRLAGQRRPRRESNQRPNKPPFKKPDGEQEQNSSAHINQTKNRVQYHNIEQIYHLERRFFL
ncbi:MAG TPA: radical SAM protein [Cyanobacteria bacterium UBA8553]|nr:radical SAM protein [Cyanobacteria bacterium UBA8553]